MAGESESTPDPFRASLLGGICAAAAVLAFLGLHFSLHHIGGLSAEVIPLVPTSKIMRPLAGAAIPLGLAIGLGAGLLRRHRMGTLIVAGTVAYVLTSVIATAWLKPNALGVHTLTHWIGQGISAALTYALIAGPPLAVAVVALERLTRPPIPPGDDDGAADRGDEPGTETPSEDGSTETEDRVIAVLQEPTSDPAPPAEPADAESPGDEPAASEPGAVVPAAAADKPGDR